MQPHHPNKLSSQHPDPHRDLMSLPHTAPHRHGGRRSHGAACWVPVEQAHTEPRRLTQLSWCPSTMSLKLWLSSLPEATWASPAHRDLQNPIDRTQQTAPRRMRRTWKLDLKVKFTACAGHGRPGDGVQGSGVFGREWWPSSGTLTGKLRYRCAPGNSQKNAQILQAPGEHPILWQPGINHAWKHQCLLLAKEWKK